MLNRLKKKLANLIARKKKQRAERKQIKREIKDLRKRYRKKKRAIKKLDKKIGTVRGKIKNYEQFDRKGGEVVMFEGKPVVEWIAYWLWRARKEGWKGQVNSGYRSPEYSKQLCYEICGAPTCPGRCAGTTSNHTQKGYLNGAVDVSDPATFGAIMKRLGSPLKNLLGSADPWHFSASGR